MPSTGTDLRRPWRLDRQVALRPESFGALAYHYGTRRLSFIKSPVLVEVLRSLETEPNAEEACRRAGVTEDELPRYEQALNVLVETGMIIPGDET
jgi:mycofactocin biosynthesis protein MftB